MVAPHSYRVQAAALCPAITQPAEVSTHDADRREPAGRQRQRRGFNKACVAIANKNARIAWALLAKDEDYRRAA
jgi:hypothetical protein